MEKQLVDIDEHIIVESRLISLNSKYATERNNGEKLSQVSFDFNAIARKDAKTLYHTIAIQSAEIPASYYIVNETNNIINLTNNAETFSVVIAPGNYDALTFAAAFNLDFNAKFTNDATLEFNAITGKYSLLSDVIGESITMNLAATTAQTLIGVSPSAVGTLTFPFVAPPTPMPKLANFLGVTKIKVASNALAGANYDSVSLNTSTLVDTISTTATAFGLTIYNNIGRESFVKAKRIDEIDIQLYDQDDTAIDFNGIDWNFTIILNTHRKQTFSNTDGIINFQKLRSLITSAQPVAPLKEVLKDVKFSDNIKENFVEEEDVLLDL